MIPLHRHLRMTTVRHAAIAAGAALLVACGTAEPPPPPPAAASTPSPTAHCTPPPAPELAAACALLANGDDVGARLALREIIDDRRQPRALRRAATLLFDNDLALLRVEQLLARDEIFLVEGMLAGVTATDDATRARVARLRARSAALRAQLAQEAAWSAEALRHVLETERLFRGDYPLERAQAEQVLAPLLARLGDHYLLAHWEPTLRGYRLQLQDRRSGELIEVGNTR